MVMECFDVKRLYACFLCTEFKRYSRLVHLWAGNGDWGDYDGFWNRYKIIEDWVPRSKWRQS
jgi:hypothetical protein